jgi:crotonobetainyl-CoA hydratase
MAVNWWQQGRVRVVVIDRPDRANAIDLDTSRELSAVFDAVEHDDDTWAVVLTGAGERVFSAGMDLRAVEAGQAAAINGVPGGFAGIVRRDFPKPLVAAVNGAALGGGFEIVLACDLVVAADTARFGLPEVMRGLIAASGGLIRLPSRLPAPLAMEHILLGEPFGAERAHALSLVNRVVPAAEVVPTAVELAERICANGPLAVRASKRVARAVLTAGEEAGWRLSDELAATVTASRDAAEAAAAARESRAPAWSGR